MAPKHLLFAFLFVTYSATVFCRKSLTAALPSMLSPSFTMADAGALSSVFGMFYAGGRLSAGFVVDRIEANLVLSVSIFLTGIINIAFSRLQSSYAQVVLWGMNGLSQAFTWPAVSTILLREFSQEERGRYWSLVSMSQHLAISLLTIISAPVIAMVNWDGLFLLIGTVSIAFAPIAYFLVRNFSTSQSQRRHATSKTSNMENGASSTDLPLSRYRLNISMLVIVGFCFNFLKATLSDWGAIFLIKHLDFTVQEANNAHFMFAIGGALGTGLSGEISGYVKGRRDPVNKAFSVFTFLCGAFYAWSLSTSVLLWSTVSFGFGFAISGPSTLLNLQVQETAQPKSSAQSIAGFVAFLSNFGAVSAGTPLSWLVETYGWGAYSSSILGIAIVGVICQMIVDEKRPSTSKTLGNLPVHDRSQYHSIPTKKDK